MALPNNALQQVQTYQRSELGYLENLCCLLATANKKFNNFQDLTGNLGSTVTFDLPPRGVVTNSLVVNFQSAVQRVLNLTVDQQMSYANAFSAQQFMFNAQEYMDQFGKAAIYELGTKIEENLALNAISGVINNDPTTPSLNGTKNTFSGPYRFYGDGKTPINSVGQLSNMLAAYRNYGAIPGALKVYLTDIAEPQIVNTMLNQFVMDRNEESAMSWMVGNWNGADFYRSNLMPIQYAGNVGNDDTTLTLVSTNDPTGANVTQLTFSGASASDSNAIHSGDLAQFQDGVSGLPNIRFLTFTGHSNACVQPVQIRANASVGADGAGTVVVNVTPALCWQNGNQNQNLSRSLQAGMQVKFLPDHHAGLVVGGNAFYMAMPKLPDQIPYPTSTETDKSTGASLRHYFGSQFGQNQQGYVRDVIYGSVIVPEDSMRIAFPLTQ